MKVRKDEWLTTILFCAFIGVMAVLYLVLPKDDFSETEKRYLSEPPVLTLDTLTSGEFGEDIETYMADHMPGRDFFVGLNAYFDLLTGRQVSKDVYVAKGDRVVQTPVTWNQAQVDRNMAAINTFADTLGRPVDLMIVPSAGWAQEELILGIADPYEDDTIIRDIYAAASENVSCIDLTGLIAGCEAPEQLYYRTDHHWTSLGAYTAYEAYMQALGREFRDKADFTVETAENFQGSNYSTSALWLIPGEDVELWTGSSSITVTNSESDLVNQGVFYRNRLEELDKYTVFLDGNHSLVRIHNPEAAGKGSILVIRDSYSNCLGGFLAESYETVVLVDLRYYKDPISELCAQESFDDVLVCYSIGNFMTDPNFPWLQ